MQLKHHSNFDILTYRGVGVAVFVLSYALMLMIVPDWDWFLSLSISTAFGVAASQIIILYVSRSKGLCFEVRFSRSRPNLSVLIIWQGLKNLNEVVVDLDGGSVDEQHVLNKYRLLINQHRHAINRSNQVHIVGCGREDAESIYALVKDVLTAPGS